MKKSRIAIALGFASTSLLTGCDGGSSSDTSSVISSDPSSDTPTVQTTYSVKAIDGYLRNATVWLDLDGDYQLDSDEPQATSGAGGVANLNVEGIDDPSQYNVVVQATTETVDEDTITESNPDGETVATPYMMSAPAGAQTVTPLTTKVHLVLEKKKAELSSSSTTELTDEEVEALKKAAINEVAGDSLDPELIMGDYIEIIETSDDPDSVSDAARLAYEAKVLVESQQLPETPEELDQAIDEIKADPTTSSLLNQLDAVSEQTQKSIETIAKEATSDDAAQNIDFETLELPDFVSEDNVNNLTDDPDNDGIATAFDAFPNNSNEWLDTDGDGIGNNKDTDDDGDGILDTEDDLPLNEKETVDTDNDGLGNNADTDDDNDGVADTHDAFPLDENEFRDSDRDGTGNNADTDDDNDDILDAVDPFPFDPDESADFDNDGIGDATDTDDDNDGIEDTNDAFPFDYHESVDSDKDGVGNNEDTDDDNDKVLDTDDTFPLDPTESVDTDNDGIGNNTDTDDDNDGVIDLRDYFPLDNTKYSNGDYDGDGVSDIEDVFPSNPNEQYDSDQDGIGDNRDTDDDNDGVLDTADALPFNPNEFVDSDQDGTGDNADTDDDNDGVADTEDAFPLDAAESSDSDRDGTGDIADNDDDNDGILDNDDLFPLEADKSADADQDGIGDATDTDDDNDGVEDTEDAFPFNAEESVDTDKDGIGNNEDTDDDNDSIPDTEDAFSLDPTEFIDTDEDGIGNRSDADDDGDGVNDLLDFFPLDSDKSSYDHDTDGDGIPDFKDEFPQDATESADADQDGTGNNADTDDDNDGTLDDADAFPFNPNETADTDGDKVGDNTDAFPLDDSESKDTDEDGVGDNADEFPLDATESLDSDGDGIGNNADPDDNNNGIADVDETTPTASDAIQFIRGADSLYILDADDEYDDSTNTHQEYLYVEPILISEDKGVTQAPQLVNTDGTLTTVTEEDGHDAILTSSGWTATNSYTIDVATDNAVAYPTNIPASQLNLSLELVDLAGLVISPSTVPFWSAYKSTDAYFPPGAQAVKFIPSAAQDIYSLWIDSEVHVNTSVYPYHEAATTLDQLISATAADPSSSTAGMANPNLVYFGWDMGVELVEGGTANYYRTGNSYSHVGSGTWTRTTINGEDILLFTVPDTVVAAYGEKWDEDSPALFASVYNDGNGSYVRMGAIEQQGTSFDEEMYLFNETAKIAILEQVVITSTDRPTDGSDKGDANNGPDIVGGVTTDASDADVANFIGNTAALYEFDDEGDSGKEVLTVDAFIVNGQIAQSQGFQVIQSDGTLGSVMDDHEDMVLTSSGWVTPAGYTLDISGSAPVAYPTGYSELVYSLGSPMITDLAGETVDYTTLKFWSAYKAGSTTVFPTDAKALQFTPVAKQDIYSLWTDSDVHVRVAGATSEPYHVTATTLDELKSSEAAADPAQAKLIYLGWDIGVELVADNTANFYNGTTLVGSTTWTQETKGGIEVIEFTVTDQAIAAFGDRWYDDPATVLFAVHQGVVIRGTVELANQSNNYLVSMFNETAKIAILEQVDVSVTDPNDNGGSTDNGDTSDGSDSGSGDSSGGSDSGNDGSNDGSSDGSNSGDHGEKNAIADGVGITTDATNDDIVQFVGATSGLHELEQEGENGMDLLAVDTFAVNGDLAISEGFKVVLPDGALGGVIDDEDQMILVGSSWVTPTGYTLDLSGSTAIAYPTGYSEVVYSLGTPMITTLDGEAINKTNLPFWSSYKTGTETFPVDSKALQFIPVAVQEIYSLWTDSDVHVKVVGETSSGPYHVEANTLDDLTSVSAATEPSLAKIVYLGWNVGVELVEGGAANFYKTNESSYETTKVGETTWNSSEIGGKTIYQLTVTDEALTAFGDYWYDDPATVLFAENDGVVIRGTVELANQSNDYQVTFFNDTAYQAILNEVDISCEFTYTEGDSVDEFFEKVALYQACSDTTLPAISQTDIAGLALNRFNSEGLYRRKFFFDDGTMLSKKKMFDEFGDKYTDKVRRDWNIKSQDGIDYIETTVTGKTDLNAIHVLLSENGDEKTFAVFFPEAHAADGHYETSETDRVTYTDTTFAGNLVECVDDTNDVWWENSSDANYKTQADYDALAESCRTDSGVTATYNDVVLAGTSWVLGYIDDQTNVAGTHTVKAYIAKDEVTMNADNTGYGYSLKYANETFTFGWSINSAGQLVITPDGEAAQDINTITGIEGNYYTQKAYWQQDNGGEGEIYTSTIMKK